ncbi:MAG TPA: DNA translocase FtsK 4TM domain-containing protein [Candidatus Binataceae bacterium]|nr:DNA translocase FtsK 4TM domain-containing protein [Candidatus Binataceae bacterium]
MPTAVAPPRDGRIVRELFSLAILAAAAWAILSLASLSLAWRPNLGGPLGAILAQSLTGWFGYQAAVVVILAAILGWRAWAAQGSIALIREAAGGAIVVAALSAMAGFIDSPGVAMGGAVGSALAAALGAYVNVGGGYIVAMLALVGGLALMLRRAPTDLLAALAGAAWRGGRRAGDRVDDSAAAAGLWGHGAVAPRLDIAIVTQAAARDLDPRAAAINGVRGDPPLVRRAEIAKPAAREKSDKPPKPSARSAGGFKLPPLALLDTPPLEHSHVDESALEGSARVLEQKLADFGVAGRVVEVQPGPVVTMYKFEPGSGIKVSQIVNLADDLSMALRAATVRIQAPVPGEAVVGIEVPNRKREKVYLREILEADEFVAAQSHLTIALGKDIAGHPAAADLATMPHLLIAGATGTGKSVSIHTMIASILFSATADDVRFILIDPKMLELSVYDALPHLLVPVVVDPEKAAAALLWATQEMEGRYRVMRELGVRNIDGYNRTIGQGGELVELKRGTIADNQGDSEDWQDTPVKHRKLPKIVIVIDELADLLLAEGKTVERDITRLAQKARAAGIHLILATQRPSVDVLTGLIKANLPARISLQVTSRVDSRTILDSIGAERLLGAGDMLFMPPGTAKLRRLHGPFVSETEIRKVCEFIRAQGAPDYQMEILETAVAGEGDSGGPDGDRDEHYDEAVRIVMETNQASISMIQRRLRIGYNRAARMVEQMEREGLVLPADGARPREVRMRGAS